ncbi:MAG: serine/threonine-protein kinase [Myxococcota bacterium]
MACVSSDTWVALLRGSLSPTGEAEVRAHAATCATCGPLLAKHDASRPGADSPTIELSGGAMATPAKTPPKAEALKKGDQVGRFLVLETLGVGGMGAVYSAYDPELDRRVAVKTLRAQPSNDETAAHARMLREAQAMARLSHPNVVNVFDVGEHQGGIFIAMEYVPGTTLRTWMRAKQRGWREVVAVFLQAGRGLAAAHSAHLVHRDFKPANVLMGEDGRVRVTDFGVARADGSLEPVGPIMPASGDDSGRSGSLSDPLTRGDMVVGTVGYMSPEQAQAKPPDARSDQFAFCVCLWEALYGQRPFTGESPAAVTKATIEAVLPPRPRGTEVPAAVHAILVRGLAKEPEARFPSMDALLDALAKDPTERTRKALPWLGVAAVLGVILGGVWVDRSRTQGRCEAMGLELKGVWDDEVRGKVKQAFGAVQKPFAAAALASVVRALDTQAAAWTQAATGACEATFVRKEQGEDAWLLQDACLRRRKNELKSVSALMAGADEALVEKGGAAAWSLSPVAACADVARLRKDPRLVLGTKDDRIRGLTDSLVQARSLVEAGRVADAGKLLEGAVTQARELGQRALEADALMLQGQVLQAGAKFPEAAQAWVAALAAAQSVGYDEAVADAAIRLTSAVGFSLNRPAEGRNWDALAVATIERLGGDDVLTTQRLVSVARVASAEGQPLKAAAQHEEALALTVKLLGADHPLVWKAHFDLGTSYMAAKVMPKAVEHLEKALSVREREVSADHPEVAMIRSMLANAYFFAGREAASRETFQKALATREMLFGRESPRLVVLLNNFGDTLAKAGRAKEGLVLVERALDIAQKNFPAEHPYVTATHLTRGEVLLALGDVVSAKAEVDGVLAMKPEPQAPYIAEAAAVRSFIALAEKGSRDALAFAERGVAAGTKVGEKSAELVLPLLAKGQAQLAVGSAAEAEKTLARALTLAEETGAWGVYTADAAFALAKAKHALEAEAAVVRPLAERARAAYAAAEGHDAQVKAVDAFARSLSPIGGDGTK